MSSSSHNVFAAVRFITGDQVRSKCSDYVQQVAMQRQVFSNFAKKMALMGPRVVIPGSNNPDEANFSYIARSVIPGGRTVVKIGSFVPSNVKENIPVVNAYISVLSSKTGQLEAMIDGEVVTEIRTAAASVLGVQEILKLGGGDNHEEKQTKKNVAIVGCGVQGVSTAQMILANLSSSSSVSSITMLSRSAPPKTEAFTSLLLGASSSSSCKIQHSNDILKVCSESDIVILATNAMESLFPTNSFRFKEGAVVVSVGSFAANRAEVASSIVEEQFSAVVVDDIPTASAQCGIVVGMKDDGELKKNLFAIGDLINFNHNTNNKDEATATINDTISKVKE